MTKFYMVVRAVVNKTETRVVEDLLDAEIKRNLKGFLWSLGIQYMVGTFV